MRLNLHILAGQTMSYTYQITCYNCLVVIYIYLDIGSFASNLTVQGDKFWLDTSKLIPQHVVFICEHVDTFHHISVHYFWFIYHLVFGQQKRTLLDEATFYGERFILMQGNVRKLCRFTLKLWNIHANALNKAKRQSLNQCWVCWLIIFVNKKKMKIMMKCFDTFVDQ